MAVLREALTTERTNDVMSAEQVYSACEACTAKWFARTRLGHCPRCGSERLQHTAARPPWEGAGVIQDQSTCLGARPAEQVADPEVDCCASKELDGTPIASEGPGQPK